MEKYDNWLYSKYSKALHYLKTNQDTIHISLGKKTHKNSMVLTVKKKPALQWFS